MQLHIESFVYQNSIFNSCFIIIENCYEESSANRVSNDSKKELAISSEVKNSKCRFTHDFRFWKNNQPFNVPQRNMSHVAYRGKTVFIASKDNYLKQETLSEPLQIDEAETNGSNRSEKKSASSNLTKVNMDYSKLNEHAGFKIGNAGKMLACLVLAETISVANLKFDHYEAQAYFHRFFKGSYKEVFSRYCAFYNHDPEQVLTYYRKQAKTVITQPEKKKYSSLDSLFITFLRITR